MAAVVTALHIGAAPVTKTADQLKAERRDTLAARRALVGRVLELAQAATLGVGFLLVLVAG
jgi:hypothetical protein